MVNQIKSGDIFYFNPERIGDKNEQDYEFYPEEGRWQKCHADKRDCEQNCTDHFCSPAGHGTIGKRVSGFCRTGIQCHVRDIVDDKSKCRRCCNEDEEEWEGEIEPTRSKKRTENSGNHKEDAIGFKSYESFQWVIDIDLSLIVLNAGNDVDWIEFIDSE